MSQSQMLAARRTRRQRMDKVFQGVFIAAISVACLTLVVLLYDILSTGLSHLSWDFITNYASRSAARSGILAPLAGSFAVITLTAAIVMPIGVAAAIYLEFYGGNNWVTRLIQINISNLAGVPSIVYGLFGLAFFVRFLAFDRSILSASLTMALLILPVVIVSTQEALKAIPPSLAQGAYALGASRWQVIRTVVLPASFGSILTGLILAVSRAMGETAPLITVGAWAFITYLPQSVMDSFTVLPIQIWVWASRPQAAFHEIAATAIIVLLAVLLTMNAIAIFLRNKYQRKAEW